MVTWEEASAEVIYTAQDLVRRYHPHLREARIGFVFRSEAQVSKGRMTLGKCSKVSDKMHPVLDLDFLIWLAKDEYEKMPAERRAALIDHELTHITMGNSGLTLRDHDVEEFYTIIERYGLWTTDLMAAKAAMDRAEQLHLESLAQGLIRALDPVEIEIAEGMRDLGVEKVNVEVKSFQQLPREDQDDLRFLG